MTGKTLNYYASGNTSRGYVQLYSSSLQELKHLIQLNGEQGIDKTTLLKAVGEHMKAKGQDVWYIHCPSDPNALDGVIIPGLQIGVIDRSSPRNITPSSPQTVVQDVDMSVAYDQAALENHRAEIDSLTTRIQAEHQAAYDGYADALRIHDDWETLYISKMNFNAANDLTAQFITKLYGDQNLNKRSRTDYRFLGAATPVGALDFVPNLTEGLKRYFVKGRPGSGKSTMLKKLTAAGIDRGFDIEVYQCGLDPNSLDMVISRELGFAIFDSTAPHEYFPDQPTDEIIDMYENCFPPGTDEEIANELVAVRGRYSAQMNQSTAHLTLAKQLQDERALIFAQAKNLQVCEQIQTDVLGELDRLTGQQKD